MKRDQPFGCAAGPSRLPPMHRVTARLPGAVEWIGPALVGGVEAVGADCGLGVHAAPMSRTCWLRRRAAISQQHLSISMPIERRQSRLAVGWLLGPGFFGRCLRRWGAVGAVDADVLEGGCSRSP